MISLLYRSVHRQLVADVEAAMRKDIQDRIEDLTSFLDEQVETVTEYSDTLVRRLIEKITVCDEKLIVEFKSGLEIEVDA